MTPSAPINPPTLQNRPLVLFAFSLFILSTAFPVVASLIPAETLPTWVGVLDVALAFAVVVIMFWIDAKGRNHAHDQAKELAYQVYRALGHLFLLLLVIFFLAGDRVNWQVLLPGLAWRFWVLFYVLPSAFALWSK